MNAHPSFVRKAFSEPPSAFLVFFLGKSRFGLDARKVQELQDYHALTKLSDHGQLLEEVVVWRDNVVPIVDLRIRFNFGTPQYEPNTSVIIMEVNERIIGLVVDGLAEVVKLPPEQIRPLPAAADAAAARCLLGLSSYQGENLILVDIDKLMGVSGDAANQKLS